MTDLETRNISFYWATIFIRSLLTSGVRHVVISPGSRSTPLTMAAAAHPKLQKHIILDERSAAFTALGIGKATGKPAILVCTSGTAASNYYPAVIEARQSGVPLIIATADRPPHLRSTGANQAIDQIKLFGDYPVFFHEVGEPHADEKDLKRLKMLARQSAGISQQRRGPVHLNFPFRKPLEPTPDFVKETEKENRETTVNTSTLTQFRQEIYHLPNGVQKAIASSSRPLIIIGPLAPEDDTQSIASLAEQLDCPVLSESTAETDYAINGFAGFLKSSDVRNNLQPDLILRFGFQPTSKAVELALRNWDTDHHFHFASTTDWQDATFAGSRHLPWLGRPIAIEQVNHSDNKEWINQWKKTDYSFRNYLKKNINETAELTDGHLFHQLLPQCGDEYFIAVSNSFPARDIQLFGRNVNRHPLFLNRGASGIDGVISTTIGLSAGLQKPGILFIGDLAFLHDTNALLNHKMVTQNLTIVVVNNSGGSIFRMLPIKKHKDYFEEYFETPQSADIQQLVQSYGIDYHQIADLSALWEFDLQKWQERHPRLSVIECRTNSDASMALRKKLWNF
ncbi:2-succinyl-5-enolpyruvyl-6-hydroxy-3-cyclohexene-1-carboxylic-acid synthase [Aliifodinibius salicampi]|uniref:2-succinyl-5-enolpyruvyl-6-hydroxy-3-cyclohexene-1-carboxylate synthase n=1 Tax=Fodinibius salicampi TaxID=1920655 RepID=A0ABT3PUV0_9BACT|nr:2-succinyl-5-enolpyruvyl-6-hydroxy-3-cyclohexene-1-carboxylic-acid synthase [Fodinibius salicampi]MCW9711625.1 2-succinyl-5-enolpyruvyl-6-hydroxy-3-cyclohexene-1-carboxylic-acid synthase [Fodinibius salicampi]